MVLCPERLTSRSHPRYYEYRKALFGACRRLVLATSIRRLCRLASQLPIARMHCRRDSPVVDIHSKMYHHGLFLSAESNSSHVVVWVSLNVFFALTSAWQAQYTNKLERCKIIAWVNINEKRLTGKKLHGETSGCFGLLTRLLNASLNNPDHESKRLCPRLSFGCFGNGCCRM